jgi:hypothetical protein
LANSAKQTTKKLLHIKKVNKPSPALLEALCPIVSQLSIVPIKKSVNTNNNVMVRKQEPNGSDPLLLLLTKIDFEVKEKGLTYTANPAMFH